MDKTYETQTAKKKKDEAYYVEKYPMLFSVTSPGLLYVGAHAFSFPEEGRDFAMYIPTRRISLEDKNEFKTFTYAQTRDFIRKHRDKFFRYACERAQNDKRYARSIGDMRKYRIKEFDVLPDGRVCVSFSPRGEN